MTFTEFYCNFLMFLAGGAGAKEANLVCRNWLCFMFSQDNPNGCNRSWWMRRCEERKAFNRLKRANKRGCDAFVDGGNLCHVWAREQSKAEQGRKE